MSYSHNIYFCIIYHYKLFLCIVENIYDEIRSKLAYLRSEQKTKEIKHIKKIK